MSGIRWTEEQLRAFRERRNIAHWPSDAQESPAATSERGPPIGELSIWLPWPPSVNAYWRHPDNGHARGRHLVSEKGRAYRNAVRDGMVHLVSFPFAGPLFVCRLQMTLILYEPDKRRRDVDNFLKSPLDALTHAGVYADDSQIRRLFIDFAEPHKPGRLHVHLKELQ